MKNKRYRQANREALITLGIYLFFFLWWTLFAFGLGSGNPEDYSYVFGLPAWFFYSCVLGYPVITLLLWVTLRYFFVNMPLDSTAGSNEKATFSGETKEKLDSTNFADREFNSLTDTTKKANANFKETDFTASAPSKKKEQ